MLPIAVPCSLISLCLGDILHLHIGILALHGVEIHSYGVRIPLHDIGYGVFPFLQGIAAYENQMVLCPCQSNVHDALELGLIPVLTVLVQDLSDAPVLRCNKVAAVFKDQGGLVGLRPASDSRKDHHLEFQSLGFVDGHYLDSGSGAVKDVGLGKLRAGSQVVPEELHKVVQVLSVTVKGNRIGEDVLVMLGERASVVIGLKVCFVAAFYVDELDKAGYGKPERILPQTLNERKEKLMASSVYRKDIGIFDDHIVYALLAKAAERGLEGSHKAPFVLRIQDKVKEAVEIA